MKANFNTLINSEKPVLVDFYADWCNPCKVFAPVLKEVKDLVGDHVQIVKVNVDKNRPLSARYDVRGVPTLILFKRGKLLWRHSGILQKNDLLTRILNA
ncbi:thioredoxin [Sinomicrobium weinanense]|uniref:Thioredoxin n=1 Tax=Sinomicrobium weinanense TaxID=2842200 RepID=A0A926JR55_9FLAO|nr:thioredoxin [Sinomicrobium weinanense]MBC9795768.1 thioredoxin [Sinomicrobium weinanense]MBU3121812.1 thioredoxin [Sinomicrobium weinanense]